MTAPPLRDDEAALLDDIGDDEYGLWELKGSLSSHVVALLVDAIQKGHVCVFAGQFGGERRELPRDAALRSIEHPENWQHREPPDEVFGVMTTDLGMEALRRWYDWTDQTRSS